MKRSRFAILAGLLCLLALTVVVLGAYVRLSDAGLGCPDWPGCYGQLAVPNEPHEVAAANAAFPHRPVETAKAWKEMAHRYLAGVLGLAILALAILSWRHRKRGFPVPGPTLLLGLVILQALLGMWTVTLLVKPLVVTAHLLGGMAIVALLWWQALHHGGAFAGSPEDGASPILAWAWLGLVLLVGQILLGGWTSSNYAALGCTEFPTCYGGRWWPDPDFREAFVLWRGLGVDYEHGVLDSPARTAIHLAHRLGAAVVALYLGCLAVVVIVRLRRPLGPLGWGLLLVLLAQLALGVANVLGGLPIAVAVAHNGTAAILLMVLISLIRGLRGAPQTR